MLGSDQLALLEGNLRGDELLGIRVGDDVRHFAPTREWARGLMANLRGVEAEEGVFGARHDGALQGDDVGLGVPEAFGGHSFSAEKGGVEFPELEHFPGVVADKDFLTAEELSAQKVDLKTRDAAEDFGDGEVVGDEGDVVQRRLRQCLGYGE